MKWIEQSCDVWGEVPAHDAEQTLKWIERAGRSCYASEDKIGDGTAEPFVRRLLERGHRSVIEHSWRVYRTPVLDNVILGSISLRNELRSKFLDVYEHDSRVWVCGNLRAFGESPDCPHHLRTPSDMLDDGWIRELGLHRVSNPPPFMQAITVEFVTDRAVTHELVRHRPAAYSQQSQRYVQYKDELEFVRPVHLEDGPDRRVLESAFQHAEMAYKQLLSFYDMKAAEKARVVLPNQTATKIVMTASVQEWNHIFSLRCSKAAYPQIRELMLPVRDWFKSKGLLV